jgi:hypothetical protein
MEAYYKAEEPRVREIMRTLIERYRFDNRENRNKEDFYARIVVFYQNSGESKIVDISLKDKTNNFCNDDVLINFKPILCFWEDEEWEEKEILFRENQEDLFMQFQGIIWHYHISWLAYLWQEEGGNDVGIYAESWMNGGDEFNFTHFTWQRIEITEKNDDIPLTNPFPIKLGFEDIFMKSIYNNWHKPDWIL